MRINKYIANAGITSRRKADELIQKGQVQVNGEKMTEPGYDVAEGDVVIVNGNKVEAGEKKVYYIMTKMTEEEYQAVMERRAREKSELAQQMEA